MPRWYSTIKFPGQAYIITGAMVNNIYWTSACLIKFKDLMLSVLMLELLNHSPNCEILFLWTRKHINTYEYFINCYDIYEQKHIQIRTSQSSEWHHDSYGFSMGESILYIPHSTTYTCKSIHNVALDATDTASCLKSCCFSHLGTPCKSLHKVWVLLFDWFPAFCDTLPWIPAKAPGEDYFRCRLSITQALLLQHTEVLTCPMTVLLSWNISGTHCATHEHKHGEAQSWQCWHLRFTQQM